MKKKNFITGLEFSQKELAEIIKLAIDFKAGKIPSHEGKILTLLFANPSLRTRLSFESGMKKMKGQVNIMELGNSWKFEYRDGAVMNSDTQEHIKDAARVISQYTDIMGLRCSELMTRDSEQGARTPWESLKQDLPINKLAEYAEKPVINMESNMFHPCQALADMMTMHEKFACNGGVKCKKFVLTWAPHPKALPLATPHSQMLFPAVFGMNVMIANPEGFDLDEDVLEIAKASAKKSGGSLKITNNQKEAFEGADVIVAKSWASLKFFGNWAEESRHRSQFQDWTVDEEKMALTNSAVFMHCLPVRRNVVVTDGVLDSGNSLIIQEAGNRMWAQMALVSYLLNS